jgi:hypothetical protein
MVDEEQRVGNGWTTKNTGNKRTVPIPRGQRGNRQACPRGHEDCPIDQTVLLKVAISELQQSKNT